MPMLDIEKALRLQNARLSALHEVAMGLTSTLNLGDVLLRIRQVIAILAVQSRPLRTVRPHGEAPCLTVVP